MFLVPNVFNSLMKKAYKVGLAVARPTEEKIYIAGGYWEASIRKEFIPKKTLGDIIALTGELPEVGERFKATKDGNQMEMELRCDIDLSAFEQSNQLTLTNVCLIGSWGKIQRLLQDECTGGIYPVNDIFVKAVSDEMINEEKGEFTVSGPYFDPAAGILWENNVCAFRVLFSSDEKNNKILKALEGVDIMPEIPE